MTHPYRLGFAVKVLGAGGLATSDTRRWQSGPHLSRSLELLGPAFDHLERIDVRMFRLSSSTIPYGTHPDLPELHYRRQIDACAEELAALGARARALGLRLSTHPGQYTVINSPDEHLVAKSVADLEQDTALLDALGQGPEAAVVVHVGGLYDDRPSALDRWARAYETLSGSARARLALENDDGPFGVADVLELHRRTGVRIAYDHHHHRTSAASVDLPPAEALRATYATWPDGVRPKVHLSSPRVDLEIAEKRPAGTRRVERVPVTPRLTPHADFIAPWDLVDLLRSAPGPLDVMLEAKAKDLAVAHARAALERLFPDLAAAEDRTRR
ncbi:UV DNA damage repair endonuclease UvsE [Actinotalea ferrariae]|uniref:UV DNA damage repair endonuclease UvsE n=1 Tax=Actinotalea ferrariae TaxID=1386098 RepID=UPI001C8C5024|nr:UV DNA damage repair endonuclease UvsE [Actinotalea ferrariae]MBX9247107.1 UV DNA damage repair endonuclease UvsE [Actinotalea ferrariae]